MSAVEAVARGRDAFAREAWSEACDQLTAADRDAPLAPEDLDRLATAAYLTGADAASADARTRAHHGYLEQGDTIRAARSAFWLAFTLIDKPGHQAQAGGWLARVRRLLDDSAQECAEQGLLIGAAAFLKVQEGDVMSALAGFEQAAAIGAKFNDPDVTALARQAQGRILLRLDRPQDGLAMLDEVMVSVTCGEVGPMVAGLVYCSVIGACHEVFDVRRAHEWTTALAKWCAAHPDMVPFREQCLVHRSELMQLHGAWKDAIDEARRACDRLADAPGRPGAGAAWYQLAELCRVRGDFDQAEDAYRRASQAGRKPDPGLALLRLAQGQIHVADAAIRRVLQEPRGPRLRIDALRAAVEIMLAADDLESAHGVARELAETAAKRDAPTLHAASAQASGAVALAAGLKSAPTGPARQHVSGALDLLREAWTRWQEIDAPYEAARVRALIAVAYRALGDDEGAQLELEAAQETLERLGAAPDANRVAALLRPPAPHPSGPLTGRELEILRLLATGRTNRMIAVELAISEKTVARHVSNIFTKLDLSSRSAATAYAYQHKLV